MHAQEIALRGTEGRPRPLIGEIGKRVSTGGLTGRRRSFSAPRLQPRPSHGFPCGPLPGTISADRLPLAVLGDSMSSFRLPETHRPRSPPPRSGASHSASQQQEAISQRSLLNGERGRQPKSPGASYADWRNSALYSEGSKLMQRAEASSHLEGVPATPGLLRDHSRAENHDPEFARLPVQSVGPGTPHAEGDPRNGLMELLGMGSDCLNRLQQAIPNYGGSTNSSGIRTPDVGAEIRAQWESRGKSGDGTLVGGLEHATVTTDPSPLDQQLFPGHFVGPRRSISAPTETPEGESPNDQHAVSSVHITFAALIVT